MGNELKYDLTTQNELVDDLMGISVLYEKSRAVMDCIMCRYFDNNIVTDNTKPGLTKEMIAYTFPHMQQLAFIVTDYLYDLGKAIKAMRENCTIHPEPPQGE